MYFDSHAHLSSPEILPHIDDVMARCRAAKVDKLLNICTDRESCDAGLELEKRYREIKNAGATTPHDVDVLGEADFAFFVQLARDKMLVAVGETGLDYHYAHSKKETQKKFLVRYLELARDCKLPVIFHCREAFDDLFAITRDEWPSDMPAILHCFTGTMKEAEKVIEKGWFLSLSGIVTFKKSEHLREVAKIVPLNQLLIETDAPYLAPQSKRGKQNEPSFLPEIAQCVADSKKLLVDVVVKATHENGCRIFNFN